MSDIEKAKILNEHEVSSDEMEAVSGGVVIDWDARCEATVKSGTSCWGTDACYGINVKYMRDRAVHGCSATVESTGYCSSNDYCDFIQIRYELCTGDWVIDPEAL